MGLIIPKLVGALLKPPAINLLLACLAYLLRNRLPRLASGLLLLAVVSLYAFSLPIVAGTLARALERYPAFDPTSGTPRDVGAIVLLGGGRDAGAPEYGGEDTVSGKGLVRVRYAAWLARRTSLPVLVSGGSVFGGREPESAVMARVLREEFGVGARWRDERSRTTAENALESARILQAAGITRVLLVTHATHMPRAVDAFRRAGLGVVPAPTAFAGKRVESRAPPAFAWVPSASALATTSAVVHEWLGMLWYRLRDSRG